MQSGGTSRLLPLQPKVDRKSNVQDRLKCSAGSVHRNLSEHLSSLHSPEIASVAREVLRIFLETAQYLTTRESICATLFECMLTADEGKLLACVIRELQSPIEDIVMMRLPSVNEYMFEHSKQGNPCNAYVTAFIYSHDATHRMLFRSWARHTLMRSCSLSISLLHSQVHFERSSIVT